MIDYHTSLKKILIYFSVLLIVNSVLFTIWLNYKYKPYVPEVLFTLTSGKKISTKNLLGKVYIVIFLTDYCPICKEEFITLKQIYDSFHKDGLEIIAVLTYYNKLKYVINYARIYKIPFKISLDNGSIATKFGNIQFTPTTFLINSNGLIINQKIGSLSYIQLKKMVKNVLLRKI